jgi:hypothetical protein
MFSRDWPMDQIDVDFIDTQVGNRLEHLVKNIESS